MQLWLPECYCKNYNDEEQALQEGILETIFLVYIQVIYHDNISELLNLFLTVL